MERRLNRDILDKWIKENGPDGVSQLATKTEYRVSAETIKRVRASGKAPKKLITCQLLSKALGVELDEAFPLVAAKGKKQAS